MSRDQGGHERGARWEAAMTRAWQKLVDVLRLTLVPPVVLSDAASVKRRVPNCERETGLDTIDDRRAPRSAAL